MCFGNNTRVETLLHVHPTATTVSIVHSRLKADETEIRVMGIGTSHLECMRMNVSASAKFKMSLHRGEGESSPLH